MLEYQNIKMFRQKVTFQIGLKKILWLKKLKTLCCEHISLVILMEKKFLNVLQKRIAKNKSKRV